MIKTQNVFRTSHILLYNADFLKLNLPTNKIDLIITSPPYNINIKYDGYEDNLPYNNYLDFSSLWLTKCFSILKRGGRLCINVPINTKNKSISADITFIAKKAGFTYKGQIIWNKQNVKNKFAMTFSKNLEVILIFFKDEWLPIKSIYKDWVNEIWQFSGENPNRVHHPAAFPAEIPRRLIKMFSPNVVLDPFVGSGTTLAVCKELGTKGVGVEISKVYFENIKTRITK